MKKLFISIAAILLWCTIAIAQTPEAFKYQAVARYSSGEIMADKTISVRFSIFKSAVLKYSEVHSVKSNEFGLFTIEVGRGTPGLESFGDIEWNDGNYFLKVEIDQDGGSNFILLGMSELLAVPYAMHAETVTHNDDADADPANEIQDLIFDNNVLSISENPHAAEIDLGYFLDNTDEQGLSLDGNELGISGGNSVDLSAYLDNTDAQTLSISNDTVYLYNGGFVKLPAGFDGDFTSLTNVPANLDTDATDDFSGDYNDLSNAPTNVSVFTNDAAYLTSFTEVDGSVTNELQVISISNDTIYLSDGGFVKLPAGFDGDFSSLTNVPVNLDTDATDDFSGNYNDLSNAPTNVSAFTNDAAYLTSFTEVDGSTTNELQVISISNDTIYLSDGGFVKLPAGFDGDFTSLTNVPANLDTDATDDFSGNYNDLSNAPTNVSAFTNDAAYLTSFTEVDGSVTNELQIISISNDTIYLSDGGFVKLPAGFDGDFTSLTNVPANLDTDATDDFSGNYNDLSNAPTKVSAFANDADYLTSFTEVDGSTTNELQVISISSDTVFLSDGGFVKLPAGFDGDFTSLTNVPANLDVDATDDFSGDYNDLSNVPTNVSAFTNDAAYLTSFTEVDGSTTNELQVISISSDTIYLSDGGFVKLPVEVDGSVTNELQNLSSQALPATNQVTIKISNGTNTTISIADTDADSTNEIQTLSISNDTVSLSNGGFVKLPSGFDGDYGSLSNVPINVSDFTNDAGYLTSFTEVDGSVTNELQVISISNDTIYLSDGGFVKLPAGFDGDYSSLSNVPTNISAFTNDAAYLTSFTEVDGSMTNELQTISISNDTVFLSDGGSVKLPSSGNDADSTNELQTLSVTNDSISISKGNTVKVPDELPATTIVLSETESNTALVGAGYSLTGRMALPLEQYTTITQPEAWSTLAASGAPTSVYSDYMMGDFSNALFYGSKVYVKTYNGDISIYDPSTDSWSNAATKPGSAYSYPIWTGSKWVLVYGTNVYAYLPATNSWETLTSPPVSIYPNYGVPVWTGTEIYYFYSNSLYSYNPTTDSWSAKANPPASIYSRSGTVWTGSKIIAVNGTSTYSYDPSSNTWATMSNAPTSIYMYNSRPFTSGNMVYYLSNNTFYSYNYVTDSWTTKTYPFTQYFYGNMAWTGSEMICVNSDKEIKSFNPSTDSWTNLTAPLSGDYYPGAACYGENAAYFFYGSSHNKYEPSINIQGFSSSSATYYYLYQKD